MYPPTIAGNEPDAIAYEMAGSGARLTYRELDERSNQVAHLLRSHEVNPGDALAILLPNSLPWPIAVAAGMRTGLQVTPVNWHLKSSDLTPILGAAAPGAVVTNAEMAPLVRQATADMERPPLILSVDSGTPGATDFWSALDGFPTTPVENELLGARTLFSGGTTGTPKAYRQPLLGIHPLDAPTRHPGLATELGITDGIRFLSPAPNYHAAPFTFQLMVLAAGGTVVCMESFDAARALRTLHDAEITHSQWVPTMLSRLLTVEYRDEVPPARSHRVAVTSGAPCPPELKDRINDWWGDILHEYYGASEGYGHTYISPGEARERRGSVGRPLGAARVRVVDRSGRDVPVGTDGSVCFEATSADGATSLKGMGDLGHLDDDGYLYLSGRSSFMIISGGVNIHPEEIEAVLSAHPAVSDVAVFGVPHADFGEEVVAVVEPAAGSSPDARLAAMLTEHCRARLARFKSPRRFEFVDDLPRLPTGKLNKRALQSEYASRLVRRGPS
ncbi:AMP-binding protein [Dietzia sp. NPDC055877]